MRQEVLSLERREIFQKLKNFPEFYLAGGTALALQIGHRISIDFDLFSEKDISLNILKISEIAAMKAYTLGRRGTLKDYVDLYFFLKEKHIFLKKIIEIAQKKYKEKFDARLFLEQLIYLDDVEDMEIQFLRGKIVKIKLQKFFEEEIKKL